MQLSKRVLYERDQSAAQTLPPPPLIPPRSADSVRRMARPSSTTSRLAAELVEQGCSYPRMMRRGICCSAAVVGSCECCALAREREPEMWGCCM
jgi:hypothetical protein